MLGPDRVARFMLGIATKAGAASYEPVEVNGRLGLVAVRDGERFAVLSFTVDEGLVSRVDIVLAPDKLGRPGPAGRLAGRVRPRCPGGAGSMGHERVPHQVHRAVHP